MASEHGCDDPTSIEAVPIATKKSAKSKKKLWRNRRSSMGFIDNLRDSIQVAAATAAISEFSSAEQASQQTEQATATSSTGGVALVEEEKKLDSNLNNSCSNIRIDDEDFQLEDLVGGSVHNNSTTTSAPPEGLFGAPPVGLFDNHESCIISGAFDVLSDILHFEQDESTSHHNDNLRQEITNSTDPTNSDKENEKEEEEDDDVDEDEDDDIDEDEDDDDDDNDKKDEEKTPNKSTINITEEEDEESKYKENKNKQEKQQLNNDVDIEPARGMDKVEMVFEELENIDAKLYEVAATFYEIINYDPSLLSMNRGGGYKDDQTRKYIQKNPQVCSIRYTFNGLFVDDDDDRSGSGMGSSNHHPKMYPLTILCCFSSVSISTIQCCYDAFPEAINDCGMIVDDNDQFQSIGSGSSPLHYTIIHNSKNEIGEQIVNFLCNAQPNCRHTIDKDRRTPLHLACLSGSSLNIVETLLPPTTKMTTITTTQEKGSKDQAQDDAEDKEGDDKNNDPNHKEEKDKNNINDNNDNEIIDSFKTVKGRDYKGNLPIHYASWNDVPSDVLEYLILSYPKGCQKQNSTGFTPLHLAVQSDSCTEKIKTIITGAPVAIKLRDKLGQTPLHIAVFSSARVSTINTLCLLYPKATTIRNFWSQTPLELAQNNMSDKKVIMALQCAYEFATNGNAMHHRHHHHKKQQQQQLLQHKNKNKTAPTPYH